MGMAIVYYREVVSHAPGTWAPEWPGTVKVTYGHTNTNWPTLHIVLPPKNWRWFHILRRLVAEALPIAQVQAVLALRHHLERRHPDAIRHKRKRFVQSLRREA